MTDWKQIEERETVEEMEDMLARRIKNTGETREEAIRKISGYINGKEEENN